MDIQIILRILFVILTPLSLFQNGLQANSPSTSPLQELSAQVHQDLQKIQIPAFAWMRTKSTQEMLDVAIIGGGMSGMATGLALLKEGVVNIKIFDSNPAGEEGPWPKCARMNYLRSGKNLSGPSIGIPSLTFRAWYEACYGKEAWDSMELISITCWNDYLRWYRNVLDLPFQNDMVLTDIKPANGYFTLTFDDSDATVIIQARKIVLATGREGFGGLEIPDFMLDMPKNLYFHTGECIPLDCFAGKRFVIIGTGAAGFDAAATALENGAVSVEILMRRNKISTVNKFAKYAFKGILHGFYALPDEKHIQYFEHALAYGTPPPKPALERLKGIPNFKVSRNTHILEVLPCENGVRVRTTQGDIEADLIILATGYSIDGLQRSELVELFPHILLWKEKVSSGLLQKAPKLGNFPYLGSHFQFLEKSSGEAPYLKDIYCFNYGAFLSHGLISGDIPGINVGASRLAEGIAADFFVEDASRYQQMIEQYDTQLFDPKDYSFLE